MLDLLNTGAKLKTNQGEKKLEWKQRDSAISGLPGVYCILNRQKAEGKTTGTLKLFMVNERQLIC